MFILGIAIPCHSLVCQGSCGLLHSSCCETSHGKPRTNNNDHGFGSGTRPRSDYVGPGAMFCGLVSGRSLTRSHFSAQTILSLAASMTTTFLLANAAMKARKAGVKRRFFLPAIRRDCSHCAAAVKLSLGHRFTQLPTLTLGPGTASRSNPCCHSWLIFAHEFAEVGPAMSAIGIAENHRLSPWNSTMACPDVHLRCWRVHWHQPQSRTLDPQLEVVAVQRYGRRVSSQNSILSLKILSVIVG